MKEFDFSGRDTLVVGGSSGIGNGIAQAFSRQGARVQVWGTRPRGEDYSGEEGSDLSALQYRQCDVTDARAVADAGVAISELDILVLSQGIVRYERSEFDPRDFREVVEVNLISLMTCAQQFYECLKRRRGALVIVSSLAAFGSRRGNPAYAASKAGAVSLTKTLGEAWAPEGIRVNGIAPGLVHSKLTRVTTGQEDRAARALRGIPAGRFGTPSDMAGAALFLASPLASYIVGQTLVVDGGKGLA